MEDEVLKNQDAQPEKIEEVRAQPEIKPWYVDEDEWVKVKKGFTVNDLMNEPPDKQFWLWDGYLPYKEIAGLTGPADVGKSSLLRQLALEIIRRGNTFLGANLNTRTGRVVYISTEDGKQATSKILQRIMKQYNLTQEQSDNLLFVFDIEDIANEIDALILDPHIDLIIVDCWGDIFDGNFNDLGPVRQHLKTLKALAEKYDCCVLLLHHNIKGSEKTAPDKNKMVGSQAIAGKMRSLLDLRHGEFDWERLLTIIKGNYVSTRLKSNSLVLKFNYEALSFTQDRKVPLGMAFVDKAAKFDKLLWLKRLDEIGEGLSIVKRIQLLKDKYPNDDVPSKTWFVENRQEDGSEAVELRYDLRFEGDRPVIKKHPKDQ